MVNQMFHRIQSLANRLIRRYGYEIRPIAPLDLDAATKEIIRQVTPFTMISTERIIALKNAVEYVTKYDIAGDIVKCGVWKGGSMIAVALTLLNLGAKRRLHLFDTFERMTAPTQVDRNILGQRASQLLEGEEKSHSWTWACSPLEEVKANLRSTRYDESMITYVRGPVEETIPANAPAAIAILRLDTDWCESTRHELLHLFPRLSPGGVLIIDDYGHWEGARKAVDEFIAATNLPLLLNRIDYTGRICIRPLPV